MIINDNIIPLSIFLIGYNSFIELYMSVHFYDDKHASIEWILTHPLV